MKLFFPDSCWRADLISGSMFLYFHDEQLSLPLAPSATTFLSGANPREFLAYVDRQSPAWKLPFNRFAQFSSRFTSSYRQTSDTIEPLRKEAYRTILFSYPRGNDAWEAGQDLIASSFLRFDEIANLINPFSAASELYAHIFLEKFLELYDADKSPAELIELGKSQATATGEAPPFRSVDWRPLYDYCDKLFSHASLEEILTTTYMFRMPILRDMPRVLLSNANILPFLTSLPFEATPSTENIDPDVVAWEMFRQLTSPRVDPLDQRSVKTIKRLRKRPAEINALRRRCYSLAKELAAETDLVRLQDKIALHIKMKVEPEIQNLLDLNKTAAKEFLELVFSDEKTWAGIATTLYGISQGGPLITASAAIYSLSSVGSKAVKAAAQRNQKLATSEYSLIYRM